MRKTHFFFPGNLHSRERKRRERVTRQSTARNQLWLSLPFSFSVWGLKFSPFLSPSPPFPPSFKVGVGWRSSVMLNKSPPRLLPSAAFVAFRRERKKEEWTLNLVLHGGGAWEEFFPPFTLPLPPPFFCVRGHATLVLAAFPGGGQRCHDVCTKQRIFCPDCHLCLAKGRAEVQNYMSGCIWNTVVLWKYGSN